MEYILIAIIFIVGIPFLIFLGYLFVNIVKDPYKKSKKSNNYLKQHVNSNGQICCNNCNSTQISANKKGFSFLTGLIGSQKVYITCLNCGNRWKVGQ